MKPKSPKVKIAVRDLFKVFGEDPVSILPLLYDGIDKAELQKNSDHILALNNINIDIFDGLITVIMGLSGSGKSTLVRHINRLIEPTSGKILMDGNDIMNYDENELRQLRQNRMSMVFQKFALMPHQTVLENTLMAPVVRGEDIKSATENGLRWLKRVDLEGSEQAYPHQLSGGMQQRVGLARALTSNAEIMLMDEAFSALDPLIRTAMQDLFLKLQQDLHKTIIFITHDLDEALKLADHLVILKDGFVVQQGEPQQILLKPSDPYIEEFVSDINRARVLKIRSVMEEGSGRKASHGSVNADTSLETLIAIAEGDTNRSYEVEDGGNTIGTISMQEVFQALVRYDIQHHQNTN